jgi:hypothetical protein
LGFYLNQNKLKMKELRFRTIWVVDAQNIQWGAFQYKKDAILFAKKINGIVLKRKCLTDKYNDNKSIKSMAEYLAK